jgi:hypothetical protein
MATTDTFPTDYNVFIIKHDKYKFIPEEYKKTWVIVSKQGINPRKQYWLNLKQSLIDDEHLSKGCDLSDVARFIHPLKWKQCQVCKKYMSLYYVYPTQTTLKWLKTQFSELKNCDINFHKDK